jgi:radical SAM superfamily enzyme YgiQ (UPF0313 family)
VFLCDGDALIVPQQRLVRTLEAIRLRLPWVERVGVYGDTRSVLRKSTEELRELRELGLRIVYHGVESGDEEVLRRVDKGGKPEEVVRSAERLRQADIAHSVIVMLGLGGTERSQRHAEATSDLLSRIDPPYVGVLTTTVVPGTPLHDQQVSGEFALPSKFDMLRELVTIVERAQLTACRFSSNHASNYLPVRCTMSEDRDKVLRVLRAVLATGDEQMLRPEWSRGL